MSACRLCGAPLSHVVADLGTTPLANAYLRPEQLGAAETYYPLRALVCGECFLMQLEAFAAPEVIFDGYAYFSSYSDTLLAQARAYAERVSARLGLQRGDRVVEVASNDGYLLQYFLERGHDVLGIEPAATVAEAARAKGVTTLARFFGADTAREAAAMGPRPRLLVANNVLAHVPDLHDFVEGLRILLAPGGTLTVEVQHLLPLLEHRLFDTIYHEHFQYFSLDTARRALAAHGLRVVDVEEVAAQGGSIRVYACHADEAGDESPRVAALLAREEAAGLRRLDRYDAFGAQLRGMKLALLEFLIGARRAGQSVVAYGAAAKGNTLLNYCGVTSDLVDAVVDRNPHKQGRHLPGSRLPIYHPDRVRALKPAYLLLLPWNLGDEIMAQMAHVREWGGRFVVAVPELRVLD